MFRLKRKHGWSHVEWLQTIHGAHLEKNKTSVGGYNLKLDGTFVLHSQRLLKKHRRANFRTEMISTKVIQRAKRRLHKGLGDDAPVFIFSKLNKIFFGYFDPENIFLDNENK